MPITVNQERNRKGHVKLSSAVDGTCRVIIKEWASCKIKGTAWYKERVCIGLQQVSVCHLKHPSCTNYCTSGIKSIPQNY